MRWLCNACEEPNEPVEEKCLKCGCPKGASGMQVELIKNPNAQKLGRAEYDLSIKNRLLLLPILLLAMVASGAYLEALMFLSLASLTILINKPLRTILKKNVWLQSSILKFLALQFICFISMYILYLLDAPQTLIYGLGVFVFISYMYFDIKLFRSEKGKELVEEYMRLTNK